MNFKTFPYHPILILIFQILSIASININEVSFGTIFYVLIIFLSTSLNTFAQIQSPELPLFIKDYDLKLVNVDQLSDDEISKIVNELEKNNMSFEMLKPIAISNGLSEENFEKLQNRILSFLSVQDLFEDESTQPDEINSSARD